MISASFLHLINQTDELSFANQRNITRCLITGLSQNFNVQNNKLCREAIVEIFNNLESVAKTITVSQNPGTADLTVDDLAIATDKGWTVVT